MHGLLFVISAPSGGGKSTIVGALRERINGLGYSVSHTSRVPRTNETEGVDYHFVDRNTFKKMVDEGNFVEWAEVYGNLYGTSVSSLNNQVSAGMDVILDVDTQGGANIRKRFKESILIFLVPPSLKVLEARLRARASEEETTLRTRLTQAEKEIRYCTEYDYIVINDDLEKALSEVETIILSAHLRTARQLPVVKKMFHI
ncbi:MAG: guanylate kinase [Desulfatiglandaceae bacterium]